MRKTKEILEETINIVTGQRQEDYGAKVVNHKNIAELWNAYLDMDIAPHDVAICMLLVKVARLKNRKTKDCYVDMAGYAAIAGEINDTDTSISTTK